MEQQAKLKSFSSQLSNTNTTNSMQTSIDPSFGVSKAVSDIGNCLDDSAWYPEQYNASFIAYPRQKFDFLKRTQLSNRYNRTYYVSEG